MLNNIVNNYGQCVQLFYLLLHQEIFILNIIYASKINLYYHIIWIQFTIWYVYKTPQFKL